MAKFTMHMLSEEEVDAQLRPFYHTLARIAMRVAHEQAQQARTDSTTAGESATARTSGTTSEQEGNK